VPSVLCLTLKTIDVAADGLQRKRESISKFLGDKKMKVPKIATILCTAIVLALPCVTKACLVGTMDIVQTGFGACSEIQIWGGGYDGEVVYGGVYMLDKSDGSGVGDIWPDGQLGSFCMELYEDYPQETFTYDLVTPQEGPVPTCFLGGSIGADKAEYLRELWGRFFDPAWFGSGPFTSEQNSDAAAFAAAVWEIVHENLPSSPLDWDVTVDGTAGDLGFSCAGIDTAKANDYLHALTGCGPKADLMAVVRCGSQDYLIQVPEPATIALLGLGGVLSLVRKRRAAV
jgi:hypothetical protein